MDKRKLNGGHSTKTNGLDRRKNQYKSALAEASTKEDVVEVIHALKARALQGDAYACKLYLEYYLGKPTQTLDVTTQYKMPEWVDEFLSGNNEKLEELYGIK